MGWDNIMSFSSPHSWIILTAVFIIIYVLARKKSYPKLIDISNILKDYTGIYVSRWDIAFSIVVPVLLSIATAIKKPIDTDMSDLLCVVISILAAAVISFMAMTSERYDGLVEKKNKDMTDNRNEIKCMESLSAGLFNTLLSVILLVLLFVRPIFENHVRFNLAISVVVYALFYHFLFNLLMMMRRLREIYANR